MHRSSPLSKRRPSQGVFSGLFLLILLIQGCSLSPTYVRPEVYLQEHFESLAAPVIGPDGQPSLAARPEDREWWMTFNSKALPLLQERALANNHAFAADRFALAQALSQARISRADLFPSLDLAASGSRRGTATSSGYQVTDAVSGVAQASYELDIWGKNLDSARAGSFTALAGLYAWRGAGLSLESEVALTYFSYLAARQNLRVYDSMLQNALDVLDYQEKRERLGAVAPLDVVRQRASVQSMMAQRIAYEVNMTEARNNLALLIGFSEFPLDLAGIMEREQLMDILPPPVNEGLPSELLYRRPDIAEAEARLMAANANIGVARAAFLPSISLTASAGWQSDSLGSLIGPSSALYSLASSITTPIFQGGRLLAQLDIAEAARDELVERYRENALNAFWEVSTALESNTLLVSQELHREMSSTQASEAYRIARVRYEAGAEDFLSVLDAQDTMLSAESSLIQTRLERLNSVVTLFKALGGGWGEIGPETVF